MRRVLVDPPLTAAQAETVADRIQAGGRKLMHIFATHAHGDHWFPAAAGPPCTTRSGSRRVAPEGCTPGVCNPEWVESLHPGGRLSDAEVRELSRLLARFVTHNLDQWENWRIETSYGPVYVLVTNELPADWPEDAFTTIWPVPAHLAERGRSGGWVVWRQDDNGNQYGVSRHDNREEADTVASTMEARGHKQTFWVAPPA